MSTQDPMGVGLSVVDNIFINGKFIRSGNNNRDRHDDEDEDEGDED